jgi:hypothetical protein
MENYADYDFYINQYKGSLSNDLFDTLIIKASRGIDRNVNVMLTQEIINDLTETEQWQLKYVACELVDFINNNGLNSDTTAGANSISIDGVSINKNVKSEDYIKASKKKIYDNLPMKLTRYL